MTETQSLKLNIDGSGAKSGAATYKAAVSQIIASTKALKSGLDRMDASASKVDFSNVARQMRELSRVRVDGSTATEMQKLATAMRNFRAPSANRVRASTEFLKAISGHRIDSSLAGNIGALSAAMNGFKAPSKAKAASVASLISTLNTAKLDPATGAHLAAVTAALSGFRGPSAAAVRNVNGLVISLNGLKTPASLPALASALTNVSAAAGRGSTSHARNASAMRTSSAAAQTLRADLSGLGGSLSLASQAGAALGSIFSTLTFSAFVTGIYQATSALDRFQNVVSVTNPNLADTAQEMEFASNVADRYGMSLEAAQSSFGKFSTSSRLAGQSSQNTQFIFESMSSAMRVLGTTTEGQSRVFNALSQMFSKGTISAEELKQQLGDELPGAFELMQQALSEHLGKPVDLSKMLQNGQVDSSAVLLLAKKVSDTFGGQVAGAMNRADSKVAMLGNSWTELQQIMGRDGGIQNAIGDVAQQLAQIFNSDSFRSTAIQLAQQLATGIRSIGDAAAWALAHVKEIGSVIAGMLTAGAVSTAVKLASAFGTLGKAGAGLGVFAGAPALIGAATAGLVLYRDELVKIGGTSVSVGVLAEQALRDVASFAQSAWAAITSNDYSALITEASNFALATGSAFDLITLSADENARLTSSSWVKAFSLAMASGQAFGTKVLISAAQIGAAGKNYAAYLAKSLVSDDKEALWREFITKTKGEFDYLEGAAGDTYKSIIEKWNLSRDDVANGLAGNFAKRAKELSEIREVLARDAEKQRKAANQNKPSGPITSAPDLSTLNPLKDSESTGDAKNSVSKRLKDAAEANRDYRAEVAALMSQLSAGKITLEQYNAATEFQSRTLQDSTDPYGAMVRAMTEDNSLLAMSKEAQEQERAVREARNALLEKGVALTDQQAEAIRKLVAEQQKLNKSNPYKDYVDGIQDFGRATDEIAVKAVDGLADQIASAVATGKADFGSLAQSILQMFIKSGLQSLFKSFWGDSWGGAKTATEQNVSTSAKSYAQAAAAYANDNFASTSLRGGFGPAGDPATASADVGRRALQASSMSLRGGLDFLGNSTGKTLPTPVTAAPATGDKSAWLNQMYQSGRNSGLSDLQARVMASQAALESGWGKSGLSTKANNYFGMKAGKSWTGDTITMPTKEQRADGSWYTENARFRRYGSVEESMADKSAMMRRNWPDAMNATTWDGAMSGLRNGRFGAYATDQNYAGKLSAINAKIQPGAAIDSTVTSSISQVNTSLQTLGSSAQQAAQQASMANQMKTASDQQAATALQTAGAQATGAAPQFTEAGEAIASAGSQAGAGAQAASGAGIGDLASLASMVPGAGSYVGMAQKLLGMFGLFEEGGISGHPVAFAKNLPHFAEGTANTGSYGRGGIPSVLHPNEAVIPLSRGRKVPVEMNGADEGSGQSSEFSRASGVTINQTMQLSGLKSADDFKKNQRQINARMASDMQRAQRRNA